MLRLLSKEVPLAGAKVARAHDEVGISQNAAIVVGKVPLAGAKSRTRTRRSWYVATAWN